MSEVPLYASRRGSPACLYLPAVVHPSGPLGFGISCAVTWPRLPCQDLSLSLSLSLAFSLSCSCSLYRSYSLSLSLARSLSLLLTLALSFALALSNSLLQRAGALPPGAYWWCAPDSGAWAEVDVTD